MELIDLINKMYRSDAVRSLLPIHQGILYPFFTTWDHSLCAHFLTNASQVTQEGLMTFPPEYHILFQFPECSIRGIRELKYDPAFRSIDFGKPILRQKLSPDEQAQTREAIRELERLANEVLHQWEQNGCADVSAYHSQLRHVLTDQQYQMYCIVTGCD